MSIIFISYTIYDYDLSIGPTIISIFSRVTIYIAGSMGLWLAYVIILWDYDVGYLCVGLYLNATFC